MVVAATIRTVLASGYVGGILAVATVVILFAAQLIQWRRPDLAFVRVATLGVASVACVLVAVFVIARFAIIH